MTDASYRVKQVYFELVHCWTRLSVGMSWDWGHGGDPLYAPVFSLSSCHGHICPILVKLFAKTHAVYIAEREDNIYCRNWGPKFILTPQIGWILRAVSLFKNWRALFKIKGQRLWWSHRLTIRSAIGWVRSSVWKRRLFQNWGAPLNSGKLAGIRPNDQAKMQQTRKW